MTVIEFSFNTNWILAKTNTSKLNSQFWIINKSVLETIDDYHDLTTTVIQESVLGPLDSLTFEKEILFKKINLKLNKIDN